jgi:tetratricopeptide (TPR) repeat protein
LIPEMRYRLLEPLREYAWEQLAASSELAAVRTRHRAWYLHLAERADATDYWLGQREWLMRLDAELDNLRAALAWCQEEADANPTGECAGAPPGAEAGLRLASLLCGLWTSRGYLAEGLQWLEGTLARGRQVSASVRAPALSCAASLAGKRGNQERSRILLQAARDEYQKALTLVRTEANRLEVVPILQAIGDVAVRQGDLDAAWAFCVEARQLSEELGDRVVLARTLEAMGGIPLRRRDFQTARPLMEERLAICRELGKPDLLIHALGAMGDIERGEGNYARAQALFLETLTLRRKLGDQIALAQSLEDLAGLAGQQGQSERAIRLLGAAEAFLETLGARLPVSVPAEYKRTVTDGRALLGEARFAAVWAEGRKLDLEQAIAYASEEEQTPE